DVISLLRLGRDNPAESRADFNGDGTFNLLDALGLLVCIVRSDLHTITPAAAEWRVLGPGGGGAMYAPTVNPNDPDNVLLHCDMTGSYATFDGGGSWKMFNLRTVVADFEFDPSAPATVYACNTGLYRSEDGGRRWDLVYPDPSAVLYEVMAGDHAEQLFVTGDDLQNAWIGKIRVDPADSRHLWLGLNSVWDGPARLLVSADRGASWRLEADLPEGDPLAIFPGSWWGKSSETVVINDNGAWRIDESTGDRTELALPDKPLLYADAGRDSLGPVFYLLSPMRLSGSSIFGGVYRSADLGTSWTPVNGDLTKGFPRNSQAPYYNTLAVCQGHPQVVYLACESYPYNAEPPNPFGIFKTSDGGQSWIWVYKADWNGIISNNFTDTWYTESYDPSWAGSPHELGICPTNPDICYAADGHAYHTLDGGKTWETVYSRELPGGSFTSRGLDVTTCYGVHFDPFDSLHVTISYTDIGAFQSFDGGASWVHAINGIPWDWMNTCYWMEFDPEVKNRIYSVWSNCHDLPRPKMFYSGVFAKQGYYGGVAVSDNGGRSWRTSSSYMPANTICTHILLDPASLSASRTLYVCGFGRGVYKSTDSGKSWQDKSAGLGHNRNAWRLVRLPDSTLYLVVARGWEEGVGDIPGALYRSVDGAESWQELVLPAGVTGPNDLTYDPAKPRRMYLSCWPWIDRTVLPRKEYDGGLYRTEDGGATWSQVFRGDAHVYAAAVDPSRPASLVIDTFDSAAFRSDNYGEDWYRLEGYNFKWGHRPIFDPHHPGMLYLTSFGGSVFYGPAMGVPGAFEGLVNFPSSWRWGN
ncbi:MAG: hypothetical protein A3F83_16095, partial [Candidatus Glassbacteria bacterium RIFCSPLOWO2_12_FULL_58_11]